MVNYCTSNRCLVGKTAIITGANAGLGYINTLDFAKRGCKIIMACRNVEKAEEARKKIIAETGNTQVSIKPLDLDKLQSVRDFAKSFIETEERLDYLINNAGAAFLPEKITEDGLQLVMEVNYFAPFLLTILLLDLLKKSAPSRIVNVSSYAAVFAGSLDLDKLNNYHKIDMVLYGRAKLCLIYFTQVLAAKLKHTGVTVYSLHPGAVRTEFQNNEAFFKFMNKWFLTAEKGTQTQLFCALEDGLEEHSGEHFENCKVVKYCNAKDNEKALKLFEISLNLVKASGENI